MTAPGELHEEDPLWYDEGAIETCGACRGSGGWRVCGNTPEWCDANPRPGHLLFVRGAVEWFTFDAKSAA